MKKVLLGNEAIVEGALEAGVQFVSTYPGTPASEIGDIFYKKFKRQNSKNRDNLYFEYSTNEKTALEAAIGASFSGLKTLVAMKNFGLNVCLDALGPFLYTGSKGPIVIIGADDPNCHSSAQWEENIRAISYLTHIPTLEPSDPQECKDFVKFAFQLSEKFRIPVLIRTTTRVAHQSMAVEINDKLQIPNSKKSLKGEFIKNPYQFATMPPRVLEMKKELLEKIAKIQKFSEKLSINKLTTKNSKLKVGIITSGVSYLYVKESLKELKLDLPILKLGFFYPLPENKIKNFIKNLAKVLIVEELDPYLEKEIKGLAKDSNPKLQIFGKNLFPEVGELNQDFVFSAITKITNKNLGIENYKLPVNLNFPLKNFGRKISRRSPAFCPGCPYWSIFGAIKQAVKPEKVVFGGDIGCYMLAGFPPISLQDYLLCMGSSIGIAHGISKSSDAKVIAFIGDATFFHSGIPALINTIFNKSNPLIIVMDNRTTAMTGQQPDPGAPDKQTGIKIENIIKACGVKYLKIIDPVKNFDGFIKTVKDFIKKDEVSVIIARHPCAQLKLKEKK